MSVFKVSAAIAGVLWIYFTISEVKKNEFKEDVRNELIEWWQYFDRRCWTSMGFDELLETAIEAKSWS